MNWGKGFLNFMMLEMLFRLDIWYLFFWVSALFFGCCCLTLGPSQRWWLLDSWQRVWLCHTQRNDHELKGKTKQSWRKELGATLGQLLFTSILNNAKMLKNAPWFELISMGFTSVPWVWKSYVGERMEKVLQPHLDHYHTGISWSKIHWSFTVYWLL